MKKRSQMKKQIGVVIFAIVLLLCAFAYYSFYVPYTRIKEKGMAVMQSGKDLKEAFSKNDIDLLTAKLKTFHSDGPRVQPGPGLGFGLVTSPSWPGPHHFNEKDWPTTVTTTLTK